MQCLLRAKVLCSDEIYQQGFSKVFVLKALFKRSNEQLLSLSALYITVHQQTIFKRIVLRARKVELSN